MARVDPTTFGDPTPPPDKFFGIDPANFGSGMSGNATESSTPPVSLQHGQLGDGIPGAPGVSQADVTGTNTPGTAPVTAQHNTGSVSHSNPANLFQNSTLTSPLDNEHGDPTGGFGHGTDADSFGSISHPVTGGHGLDYTDTGVGSGHAEVHTP